MPSCSGKNSYRSKKAARRARDMRSTVELQLYVYRCVVCRGWHLTKEKPSHHARVKHMGDEPSTWEEPLEDVA